MIRIGFSLAVVRVSIRVFSSSSAPPDLVRSSSGTTVAKRPASRHDALLTRRGAHERGLDHGVSSSPSSRSLVCRAHFDYATPRRHLREPLPASVAPFRNPNVDFSIAARIWPCGPGSRPALPLPPIRGGGPYPSEARDGQSVDPCASRWNAPSFGDHPLPRVTSRVSVKHSWLRFAEARGLDQRHTSGCRAAC